MADRSSSTTTMHVGEVAERVGLSLRTGRYSERQRSIEPEARTGRLPPGHRRAGRAAAHQVGGALGFIVDEMRHPLDARDGVAAPSLPAAGHNAGPGRLAGFATAAAERCDALRQQLLTAEAFAATLGERTAWTPTRRGKS